MTTLSSSRRETEDADTGNPNLARESGECVATFWRQETPGTSYVRCLLPARYLPGQCLGIRNEDLSWDEEKDQLVMPRQRGAAVWQFLGDEYRSKIAGGLQDLGVRSLIEVDDNYLIPYPHVAGARREWNKTIEEARLPRNTNYSHEMHRLLVPTMDGVIVTTEYLRDRYLEFHDEVYVCPNTVDPDDWAELEEKDPNVLRIVYSGSRSHLRDAPMLNKALKWASRQKGVEVWLQGVNPPWTFISQVPWTNTLAEYRRTLGSFDVGLAPVDGGIWAKGKSDLKALEYTMAGVVPFLAREEPYRPWFDKPDFLVEPGEQSWLEKVKWIVRNQDALPSMLEQARTYVLNERTTAANICRWEEAINGA